MPNVSYFLYSLISADADSNNNNTLIMSWNHKINVWAVGCKLCLKKSTIWNTVPADTIWHTRS